MEHAHLDLLHAIRLLHAIELHLHFLPAIELHLLPAIQLLPAIHFLLAIYLRLLPVI